MVDGISPTWTPERGEAIPADVKTLLASLVLALGFASASCSREPPTAVAPAYAASAKSPTSSVAAKDRAPSDAATIYEFSATPFREKTPKSLKTYEGQVLLVVNIASHCGYTRQMAPLGAIERRYANKRFHVLGFLSDDFGAQAGSDEEVASCNLKHEAAFDEFAIVGVKRGPDQSPLFAWLTSRPGLAGEVGWNFAKWLIDRKGQLVRRWDSGAAPDGSEIAAAIEAELAR